MTLPTGSNDRDRLYGDLASWWPLMSPPSEYGEEADFYRSVMEEAAGGSLGSLLELGCGGGNNAVHLRPYFRSATLVDLSPGMLEHSSRLNPDCEHVKGDMRTLRLERQFDVVFVHDAICYMTTREDLRLTLETAYQHCRPGGVALFAPDHVLENFAPGTDHGGSDGADRAIRFLEWTHDPDPDDEMITVDYAYILHHQDGRVTVEHDRHLGGLFPRAAWLDLLTEVGFSPSIVPFEHSEYDGELEVFICQRPVDS